MRACGGSPSAVSRPRLGEWGGAAEALLARGAGSGGASRRALDAVRHDGLA
jgi:hypothetical protein